MTITVYSRKACVQCDATKRKLGKLGLEYNEIDVDVDKEALDHIVNLGYQQLPVVETPADHWSGYRIDKLAGLTHYAKDAA